jgi:FAD/FMN-containing dehydrogenase/Fe-S oxidoreductase
MQLSPAESAQLAKSLSERFAEAQPCFNGVAHFDPYHAALYSTDASIYQIQPVGVLIPRDAASVQTAMRLAAEFRLPLVPRGAGTSLSGQSIGQGLIVDFSQFCHEILEIDAEARTARVQPGVVLDQLNAAAAKHGLQFGPDVATSSRATIGGMIGNNSAGSRSILQGKTVDHVQSLDVVLSDGDRARLAPLTAAGLETAKNEAGLLGSIYRAATSIAAREREEIVNRFPRIVRRVSGYNLDELVPECRAGMPRPWLAAEARRREHERFGGADFNLARLIVGSEGALATVVEAVVHLTPLPAARGVLVLHFDSLAHAIDAVAPVMQSEVSAVELFDGLILRLAEQSLEYKHYLDFVVGRPESLLLVEFSADSAEVVAERARQLGDRLVGQPGLLHTLAALEPDVYRHVWACRKAALPLLQGIPGARKPVAFVEDPAVDPQHLPQFVERFREILARHGTEGAFYGHASVGCLHVRPMLDLAQPSDILNLKQISREVCELVQEFGGAMSGEHGDGLARSYLNERLFGPRIYQAFRELKQAFDPAGRLNPGKIVDGPSPTANLRLGADYQRLPLVTTFDFSRQGSLAEAAELCNGAGVCRKTQTGTMCPSFMATGEEEHSTRGRANALRLALSGALPAEELTGPRLFATYDLCLQCKGCKAECPSNVDVAKMKMEFLDHYQQRHGATLGSRLMGRAAEVNRWGARLAPVSNWLGQTPVARWAAERWLGVDRRRPLPTFARNHFRRWFVDWSAGAVARRANRRDGADRGPIVLLDDCLTSYCEPEVNRAAAELLEAAGYQVQLANLGCCGRTLASKGFLREAQQLAAENVRKLTPWARAGTPIVGCEPSCLLMLVDEYPELVSGADAKRVAASAALVESHIARAGITLPLRSHSGRAIVHGHCHQKALVGVGDMLATLGKIDGLKLDAVDSGCCGMAGSFGYEHYDLSMRIGERVLLPTVRNAADALIVAPGFSCRQQILHGAARQAIHPVQLLRQLLS